jgi:hypothetical protein
MHLEIKRFHTTPSATLGLLFIDNVFECFTLEDTHRPVKIKHETRIAEGTYPLGLRTYGGHYQRYQQKFKNHQHGMIQIHDVPNFKDILIHIGNSNSDTSGCILVGDIAVNEGKLTLQKSTQAYLRLYEKVLKPLQSKEKVYLTLSTELCLKTQS